MRFRKKDLTSFPGQLVLIKHHEMRRREGLPLPPQLLLWFLPISTHNQRAASSRGLKKKRHELTALFHSPAPEDPCYKSKGLQSPASCPEAVPMGVEESPGSAGQAGLEHMAGGALEERDGGIGRVRTRESEKPCLCPGHYRKLRKASD